MPLEGQQRIVVSHSAAVVDHANHPLAARFDFDAIERAPASSAFSSSSFTTEAGRSTTSPAAILFATCSEVCGSGSFRRVHHVCVPANKINSIYRVGPCEHFSHFLFVFLREAAHEAPYGKRHRDEYHDDGDAASQPGKRGT